MKSATVTDITPHIVRRRIFEQIAKQKGTVGTLEHQQEQIESLLSNAHRLGLKYSGRDLDYKSCEFAALTLMPFMREINSQYIVENALLALMRAWNDGQGRKAVIDIAGDMAIEIIPTSKLGKANTTMTLKYTALGVTRLFALTSGPHEMSLAPSEEIIN